LVIGTETLPLLGRIGQLPIAITDFKTINVKLKSMADFVTIVKRHSRQRCLRGRVSGNENRAANSELRLNNKAHHRIQAAIPAETSQLLRLKPLFAILAKVVIGDRHRVKARTGHHRLPVGKLRWPFTTQPTAYQI